MFNVQLEWAVVDVSHLLKKIWLKIGLKLNLLFRYFYGSMD